MSAPEFAPCIQYFSETPGSARSLLSSIAQALIYCLVRNLRPEHVVEIGTFKGGTAEGICRALHANGHGTLHTVNPFNSELFLPFLETWSEELRSTLKFYPVDSMTFYMEMARQRMRPGIVLVDGNHDYEFALFDIQCAARLLISGGFILVDNVSQAGPYWAVMDFLAANREWLRCPVRLADADRTRATKAFAPGRSSIPGTDLEILRAPPTFVVSGRPTTFGEVLWESPRVAGLRLKIASPSTGMLDIQCVLRGFGDSEPAESMGQASEGIMGRSGDVDVVLPDPLTLDGQYRYYRVEPWLTWRGEGPLRLANLPIIF
jgi:hypothetical protein